MLLQIDFKSGIPVYLQLVDQIKRTAASGGIRPGESLPGIRPLAEELRLNRNTVAKAYSELESQGIVENVQGKGCFLKDVNSPLTKAARNDMLAQEVDRVIVAAHHLQIADAELVSLLKKRLDSFERKAKSANT